MNFTGAVHCTKIELRTILVTERSMTTTFFFLQDIDRSFKFLVRFNYTRVSDNHTTLDFILIDTTEKETYIITSFTFVKKFTEHFHTSNN